jgi:hypothetical protein
VQVRKSKNNEEKDEKENNKIDMNKEENQENE